MERTTPPLSAYYHHLKLYLDDLQEIENIVKDARKVDFQSEGYRFDNLAELVTQFGDQILRSIRIYSFDPYVEIDLDRSYNRLYCDTTDPIKGSGIFHRLDEVLKRASRKPHILYPHNYTGWRIINVIIFTILIFVEIMYFGNEFQLKIIDYIPSIVKIWKLWEWPWRAMALFTISTATFCSSLGMLWSHSARRVMIIVSRRSQRRNFFSRNRDQLLVNFVIAVVTIILTLVVSYIFKSTPQP